MGRATGRGAEVQGGIGSDVREHHIGACGLKDTCLAVSSKQSRHEFQNKIQKNFKDYKRDTKIYISDFLDNLFFEKLPQRKKQS